MCTVEGGATAIKRAHESLAFECATMARRQQNNSITTASTRGELRLIYANNDTRRNKQSERFAVHRCMVRVHYTRARVEQKNNIFTNCNALGSKGLPILDAWRICALESAFSKTDTLVTFGDVFSIKNGPR